MVDAMKESVINKVRKMNYVRAILERWKEEGRATVRAQTKQAVIINNDGSLNV